MYKLNFSGIFREDVRAAVKYIKSVLQVPAAAESLKNEVRKAYKLIKDMPLIYPLVNLVNDEYLAAQGFRFVMVKNYMLFFIVEPELKQIYIVRFLFGSRDWGNILRETEIETADEEVR